MFAAWRGYGRLKTEHANPKLTLNLKTMISNTKLFRNLAKLMFVAVLFVGCTDNKLKIGKKYLISFDYEEQNPFVIKDRDTVKIVGLKGNYIQWQYKNGVKQSSSIRVFNMLLQNSH